MYVFFGGGDVNLASADVFVLANILGIFDQIARYLVRCGKDKYLLMLCGLD